MPQGMDHGLHGRGGLRTDSATGSQSSSPHRPSLGLRWALMRILGWDNSSQLRTVRKLAGRVSRLGVWLELIVAGGRTAVTPFTPLRTAAKDGHEESVT